MKKYFFYTEDAWTNLILRLFLGVVMFPHGAQKLLGWFGGFGYSGTMGFFTDKLHIPAILAFIVIAAPGGLAGAIEIVIKRMCRNRDEA